MKGVPPGGGAGNYDHEYFRQVGTATFTAYYQSGNVVNHGSCSAVSATEVLFATPIVFPRGGTLDRIGTYVSAVVNGPQLGRFGLYTATSTTNLYPGALVVDSGDITLNLGLQVAAIATVVQPNVLYWGAVLIEPVVDAAVTIQHVSQDMACPITGVTNAFVTQTGINWVGVGYGALPNPFPALATFTTNDLAVPMMRWSA